MAKILSPALDKKDCYLGQPMLKRAGVKTVFTSAMVEELERCGEDPLYFIKTYARIISLDDGEVPFKLFKYQENIVVEAIKSRFTLFMLPRQMGKTQVMAGIILWYIMFTDNYSVAILSNKEDSSVEVLDRIQFMYINLPSWMQLGVVTWNKGDIKLDNGSKVITAATSPSAIRGKSINLLYLDEFAHVDRDVEFWTSSFPTISSGKTTKVMITSTPRGMNLFYKLWIDSKNGRNPFKSFFYPWTDNPTRDATWEKEQLEALGPVKFRQECACAFLGSAGTLISGDKLEKLAFSDPIYTKQEGGLDVFKVYEKPGPDRKYVMTADISEGVGADYTVVSVFDATEMPFKHVAKYRSNTIPPEMATGVINEIGRRYNEAMAIIETNSIGINIANDLAYEFEYENVVRSVERDAGAKLHFGGKSRLGVKTTRQTKRVGCSTLRSLIETDTLITTDYEAINELSSFISSGSSWEAEKGKHDDVVMSMVLFAWFTQQESFDEFVSGAMNAILRRAREEGEFGAPVMLFDDGGDPYDNFDHTMFLPVQRKTSVAEDFPELF